MADTASEVHQHVATLQSVINTEQEIITRSKTTIALMQIAQRDKIAAWLGIAPGMVFFGSLSCYNSPTRMCVFNLITDPQKDDCVFCHNDWTHG
ncbi:hypothetical protein SEA_PHRIEDRICE_28 [Microbacterium phage PhriedRice]|uniref:Uncharacterized protein n=1 Tax=Microbacterium phage PhriedRice TaxID=2652407 RepID=A0A5J6T6E6_9CAUD|nr:hypothetical protein SEA_PHRIEDRICE_28 [Microbacterium phage PhriedRice]